MTWKYVPATQQRVEGWVGCGDGLVVADHCCLYWLLQLESGCVWTSRGHPSRCPLFLPWGNCTIRKRGNILNRNETYILIGSNKCFLMWFSVLLFHGAFKHCVCTSLTSLCLNLNSLSTLDSWLSTLNTLHTLATLDSRVIHRLLITHYYDIPNILNAHAFCFTPNSPVIIADSQILAQDASPLTISCHMLVISQRTQHLLISQHTQGTTWIMHISCRNHHFGQIRHEAAP